MRILALVALVPLVVAVAPAQAAEVFGGITKHAVSTPFSLEGGREQGIDFQLGIRGGRLFPKVGIQPYAFGSLNSAGDTSFLAAGLSWKFGDRIFIRPGLGLAVHNGSAGKFDRPDRIALGSRILFEPEIGVGLRLTPRATIEATLVHLSQGQLFGKQNPGLDNAGVRFSLAL